MHRITPTRTLRAIASVVLLVLASLIGGARPTLAAFEQAGARVGIAVTHLETGWAIEHRADELFPLASVVKLPVLVALYAEVAAGHADLSERITYRTSMRVPGSGVLQDLDDGLTLTLRDVAMLMMMISDNTAAEMLTERLTKARIEEVMRELGLASVRVPLGARALLYELVDLDWTKPGQYEEARALLRASAGSGGRAVIATESDRSTPRDLCRLLERIDLRVEVDLHARRLIERGAALHDVVLEHSDVLRSIAQRSRWETTQTVQRSAWHPKIVLAIWASADMLEKISEMRPDAVCVVQWREEESEDWLAAHGAVDLSGTAAEPLRSAAIADPVARVAWESAGQFINPGNRLYQAEDRDTAVETLRVLDEHDHRIDPDELFRWAIAKGWPDEGARNLRKLAAERLAGKRHRVQTLRSYGEDVYAHWKREAKRDC